MLKYLTFLVIVSCVYHQDKQSSNSYIKIDKVTPPDTLIRIFITNDLAQLKILTLKIMEQFELKVRPNIRLDDSLKIVVSNTLPPVMPVMFGQKVVWYPNKNKNKDERFYGEPTIFISPSVDTTIENGNLGKMSYTVALSLLIHELTHYFQLTYGEGTARNDGSNDINFIRSYTSQPVEFEAYAVCYYYFLYYAKRSLLLDIMSKKISSEKKMKLVINAGDSILYRRAGPIFYE